MECKKCGAELPFDSYGQTKCEFCGSQNYIPIPKVYRDTEEPVKEAPKPVEEKKVEVVEKETPKKRPWQGVVKLFLIILALAFLWGAFRGTTEKVPKDISKSGYKSAIQMTFQSERPMNTNEMKKSLLNVESRLAGVGLIYFSVRPSGDQQITVKLVGFTAERAESLIGNSGKLVVKLGDDIAFTGSELENVEPFIFLSQSEAWAVPFTITDEAAERFRVVAIETDFAQVYMYMDDDLITKAPLSNQLREELKAGIVVQDMILQVSREGGKEKAQDIESVLRSGVLPVPIQLVETKVIPII